VPSTPEELAHLQSLTPRKIIRRARDDGAQYVYADPDTCRCVYTRTEQQYQQYRTLVRQKTAADETTLVNEEASDSRLWGLWPGNRPLPKQERHATVTFGMTATFGT